MTTLNITLAQLQSIMPLAHHRAEVFLAPLNAAMAEFEINTYLRQVAFLAQIAHESGQLLYVKEIASGSAYEGRKDLGNNEAGDGVKFKGRGLIQITGKANYTAIMLALNVDCLVHPEVLETPDNACRVSTWWWQAHGLNRLADIGTVDSMTRITRVINGGVLGLAERLAYFATALKVLKG